LRPESPADRTMAVSIPGILDGGAYPNRWIAGADDVRMSADASSPAAPVFGAGMGPDPAFDATAFQAGATFGGARFGTSAMPGAGSPISPAASAVSRTAGLPEIRPMIPLGQFRDTFIIAVDDEGIAIIDQHVAHERVLFERVMERLTAGHLESQRLLVPIVLDLPPSAHQTLIARAGELERLGFELESFGHTTIKVTAVPWLLKIEESAAALLAVANDLEGLDRGATVQNALQRIAATTACHAAVKANYPLTYDKMTHILDELRATAYSTVCPHGRPVMLRLTRREIEKNFERI
jgi:DNA mismatch repair protein MutL